MVSGIEGIGEAVTGGLMARAVEPSTGEAGHPAEGNCLNCGAELIGDYCHRCGQNGHVHRTLGAFWHDLLHGVFHFEGKIWHTLPLLAWRPGELTRRYIDGERAKFVSPTALFLFSVFMMFAVFSLIGGPFMPDLADENPAQARAEAERDFRSEQAESRAELNQLRAERQRLVQAGESTLETDIDIRNLEREMALQERLFRQAIGLIAADEQREAVQQAEQPTAESSNELDFGEQPTSIGWLNHGLQKAQDNPALLAYKLQSNAYKFSWMLIPISVPFVWLLFLHRRRYRKYKAYDHTVFVTYSIAFMSLGLIVLTLLRPLGIGEALILSAITFIPPIHIYRQLRGAYALSRWSAIWRTFVLINFAFIAATLFFVALLALGALG